MKWEWSKECEEAFQRSKSELMAGRVLVPYDKKRKLILACDASPYGVGAVISHVMDDGEEHPSHLPREHLKRVKGTIHK